MLMLLLLPVLALLLDGSDGKRLVLVAVLSDRVTLGRGSCCDALLTGTNLEDDGFGCA